MSRVLLVWELGGDYGHLGHMLPLAMALRSRGHDPVFLLRDLAHAEAAITPHGLRAFQAPLWLPEVSGLPQPANYTEMLLRFGFHSAPLLTGMVRAWRNLFAVLNPQLIVFDHSPTALLAARGLGIPRLMVGNGFFTPPRQAPLPPFRWWQRENLGERLADTERRVCEVVNTVMRTLEGPPLTRVADLLEVEADLISSFAELDHYPGRGEAVYTGPLYALAARAAAQWPGAPGKRVFAYLKPAYRGFEQVLSALAALDASVLVHAPGASAKVLKTHRSASLDFSVAPVDMNEARIRCDVAICHAGIGTCSAMLLAGKPLLALPMQMEQEMFARRLEQQSLAVVAHLEQVGPDYRRLVRRLLTDEALSQRAREFAAVHGDYSQEAAVEAILARCEALLAT